jgi:hypothetical protein
MYQRLSDCSSVVTVLESIEHQLDAAGKGEFSTIMLFVLLMMELRVSWCRGDQRQRDHHGARSRQSGGAQSELQRDDSSHSWSLSLVRLILYNRKRCRALQIFAPTLWIKWRAAWNLDSRKEPV